LREKLHEKNNANFLDFFGVSALIEEEIKYRAEEDQLRDMNRM